MNYMGSGKGMRRRARVSVLRHGADEGKVELAPRVHSDGTKEWFNDNDKLHRVDGPAIEHADGTRQWWLDGKRHRVGGPAVEKADGDLAWYEHGHRHRVDGPAIIRADGTKCWYWKGEY